MATQSSPVNEQLAVIEKGISSLRERVHAITVSNQADYIAACNLVVEGRSYVKDVKNKLGPGIDSAKTHLDFLRNQQTGFISPVQEIIEIAEKKAEFWKAEERRKAAAEEERINAERRAEAARKAEEERREAERIAAEQRKIAEAQAVEARRLREKELELQRKQGEINKRQLEQAKKLEAEIAAKAKAAAAKEEAEARELAAKQAAETAANVPAVTVAPSVPKVAGIKGRVNYKFEVVDSSKLPREYMCPDLVKIGEMVRRIKDPKKSAALIPGIKTWEEDSI